MESDKIYYQSLLDDFFGNADAADCVFAITKALHVLDDLIDGDKPVSSDDLVRCFMSMLVGMPQNKFYAANHQAIGGVLIASFCNWIAANEIEKSNNDHELRVSYIIRSTYADLVSLVATLLGGVGHGANVAKVRRLQCASEGYESYISALKAEKRRD